MDRDDPGDRLALPFLLLLLLAAYLVWDHWETVSHTGPVARADRGALWLETRDVGAGETLHGRVVVRGHLRVAIRGVIVNGAGPEQITEGRVEAWGDEITTKLRDWDAGRDSLGFEVHVPRDRAGSTMTLDVRAEYVYAEEQLLHFTNEWNAVTFRVAVPVHSAGTSTLRRAGKAAFAAAAWLGVVAFVVILCRWHARRHRAVRAFWALWLVPHAIFGWSVFVVLVADATRIRDAWLTVAGLALWYGAFGLAAFILRAPTRRRHTLLQRHLPQASGDAYRGGMPVPTAAVADVVSAWQSAGLAVQRARRTLTVTRLDGRTASVELPPTGVFGGGAPLVVTTDAADLVADLATASTALLGELRAP